MDPLQYESDTLLNKLLTIIRMIHFICMILLTLRFLCIKVVMFFLRYLLLVQQCLSELVVRLWQKCFSIEVKDIKDICFFEVNTKCISSSELKTSESKFLCFQLTR